MIGWISSILSTTTRKNSASLRSCNAFSATYFSRSVGSVRRLTSTRSTWVSIVSTQGGSKPRRPRSSRSCAVKAVPLLSRGSRSSAMPCTESDDVEWALTRAGLFTNSPREFLIEGRALSASTHLRSRTQKTAASIVIPHRSEVLVTDRSSCARKRLTPRGSLMVRSAERASPDDALHRRANHAGPALRGASFETPAPRAPQDESVVWATALLRLDVGGLHDRPPFLGLGLLEGSERRGRLLIGRRNLLPQFAKPVLDGGIGKHGDDG